MSIGEMGQLPLVSVIITTHNRSALVMETIESVLAQSFTDYEVIVVNDGSTDDTATALRPLVESGKIRYIEQENQGLAAARNTGFAEARGDLISFVDDDDLFVHDKLEHQVQVLNHNRDIECIVGARKEFGRSDRLDVPPIGRCEFASLFNGNYIHTVGQTLIRKAALVDIGCNARYCPGAEDWDMWFKLAFRHGLYCDEKLVLYYRTHGSNMGSNRISMLRSAAAVVVHQLPLVDKKCRATCRTKSASYLYDVYARDFYFDGLREIRRGRIGGGVRRLAALRTYILILLAFSDPAVCMHIVRQMGGDAMSWLLPSLRRALQPATRD